jgi:hypothetical protein
MAANRLLVVTRDDEASRPRNPLEQLGMCGGSVLVFVGHDVAKAGAEQLADVGAVPQQARESEHEVSGVHAPCLGEDPIVALVQLRELQLPPRGLALRRAASLAFALRRPSAEDRGADRLGLEDIDSLQKPCQQPRRVAADLVPAQGQVRKPVEQHRQAIGGPHRREERIQAGLDRVLTQQPLGDCGVGLDPQLLVGAAEQGLAALSEPRRGGARSGQNEHLLGRGPLLRQDGQPPGDRLRPARSRRAE